jgi:siroheme synthase-like protein
MAYLPVMLRVEGRRCVVVGGGPSACRRSAALLDAGAKVTVVAPRIDPAAASALSARGAAVAARAYQHGDLHGAFLVVVATDDDAVNQAVAAEAAASGVLVNRADAPEEGDFAVPAHGRQGPITLAVYAGGIAPAAAAAIRRELEAALDPAWPAMLEAVAPYRAAIVARFPEHTERRRRLRALATPQAMSLFKARGQDALIRRCEELLDPAAPLPADPAPTQDETEHA